ncbi:MAG: hypothetical protein AAFR98_12825 [Pseudomonadota bacterium]
MRRSLGTSLDGGELTAFRTFCDRPLGFAINFKFENGHRRALAYADLVGAEYNPDLGGIILEGIAKRVTVLGLNLEGLYEQILDHDVGEVTEKHAPEHLMAEIAKTGTPYIRQILWEGT